MKPILFVKCIQSHESSGITHFVSGKYYQLVSMDESSFTVIDETADEHIISGEWDDFFNAE